MRTGTARCEASCACVVLVVFHKCARVPLLMNSPFSSCILFLQLSCWFSHSVTQSLTIWAPTEIFQLTCIFSTAYITFSWLKTTYNFCMVLPFQLVAVLGSNNRYWTKGYIEKTCYPVSTRNNVVCLNMMLTHRSNYAYGWCPQTQLYILNLCNALYIYYWDWSTMFPFCQSYHRYGIPC